MNICTCIFCYGKPLNEKGNKLVQSVPDLAHRDDPIGDK